MAGEISLSFEGFSWVVDGQLAGMPKPGRSASLASHVAFLVEQRVGLLVSVHEEEPPVDALEAAGIDSVWYAVEDFRAPSQAQLEAFVGEVALRFARGEAVGVHCAQGVGRTGTFLAVWFVVTGDSGSEAIARVRSERPGSIETNEQEEAVCRFAHNRIAAPPASCSP